MNLPGGPLIQSDFEVLARCGIPPEVAERALFRRVSSIEGAQLVGRNGNANYAGVAIPNKWPGEEGVREYRLRRDFPDIEYRADGGRREKAKYLSPLGAPNRLYFTPATDPAWLADATLPIIVTEGEKKTVALDSLAQFGLQETARPRWLSIGLPGVFNFRGKTGREPAANGGWQNVTGMIPDFDRIIWTGRKVAILFDKNVTTNWSVEAARFQLARLLTRRGAAVEFIDMPAEVNVNGIDDLIGLWGPERVLQDLILTKPIPADCNWKDALLRTEKEKTIKAVVANALLPLQWAPDWHEVLSFNEHSGSIMVSKPLPWFDIRTLPFEWTDTDCVKCAAWLQHQGIMVSKEIAAQAVVTVARDNSFHPIRQYLENLKWDGRERISYLLSFYFGALASEYTYAVGKKLLIAAVARIFDPGCKADTVVILEGPQGSLKSTGIATLFEPYFTDDMPDIGTKDASLQVRGMWCIELSELGSIQNRELEKVKAFLSRKTDHYRPPYERYPIDVPRQCIFIGTTNREDYLKDETGNRRFLPVKCGVIDIEALKRDKDQLFAEAVARFRSGERWWFDNPELVQEAEKVQTERIESDPWDGKIAEFLATPEPVMGGSRDTVSVPEVLASLSLERKDWNRSHETRVARSLKKLGWVKFRENPDTEGHRPWRYRRRCPISAGVS